MGKLLALVLVLALAACGGATPGGPAPAGDAPAGDGKVAAPPGVGGGLSVAGTTTVKVTVTGGPRAGSYSASAKETVCSRGHVFQPGQFGVQYTHADIQSAKPEAFTSFQFVADNAMDGVRDSEAFIATALFGPLGGAGSLAYQIKPGRRDASRGTATVELRGGAATVSVSGETSDGIKLEVRVDCHAIFELGGSSSRTPEPVKGAFAITLSGGAHPGRYEERNAKVHCGIDKGSASFAGTYETTTDASKVDGVAAFLFELTTTSNPQTKDFDLSIDVRKPGQEMATFRIAPGDGQGKGSVSFEDKGGVAVSLRVIGETATGVKIDARFECAEVERT